MTSTNTRPVKCVACGKQRQVSKTTTCPSPRCAKCRRALGANPRLPPADGFSTLEHAKQQTLACRDDPEFFAYVETILEPKSSWHKHVDDLAEEAELRCWGCPFTGSCARAAVAERYTGIAGGIPWRDGTDATTLDKPATRRSSNQHQQKEAA